MDVKEYFREFNKKIDSMSGEEFDKMLKEAGIENCPYEDKIEQEEIYQIIQERSDEIEERIAVYQQKHSKTDKS